MTTNVDFHKPLVWDKNSGNFYNIGLLSRAGYWLVGDSKEIKKNVIRTLLSILTSPHVSMDVKKEWRKKAQHYYDGIIRNNNKFHRIARAFQQEIYLTKLEEKGLPRLAGIENLDFLDYAQANKLHKNHNFEYINGEIVISSSGNKTTWTRLKKDIGFDATPHEIFLSQLEEIGLPKHIARENPDFVLFMRQNDLIPTLKEHQQTIKVTKGQPVLFFENYEKPWNELRGFLRIKSWYKAEDMDLKKLGFSYVGPNGYGNNGILAYNPVTWNKKMGDGDTERRPLPCGKLNHDQMLKLSDEGISLPLIEAYKGPDETTTLKLVDEAGRIYIFKSSRDQRNILSSKLIKLIPLREFFIETSLSPTLDLSLELLTSRSVSPAVFHEMIENIAELQKKGRVNQEDSENIHLGNFMKQILAHSYFEGSKNNVSDTRSRRGAIYLKSS